MKIGFRGFLMLVILGVIIGMLLNMQIGGVSAKPAYVPPAPTKTPLEIEMEVKAAVSSFYMWLLIKWGMVIIVLLAGFWAVMRFLVVPAQKHAKTHYRDESGRYGMIRENKATIWQRLRGVSIWVESDPNLAIAPARRIKVLSDGQMEVAADTYGADMEVQARHASKQIDVDKITAGNGKATIQKIPGGTGAYKRSHSDHLAESGYYDAKSREAKMRGLAAETNLQTAQIRQQKMIEGPAKGSVEEIETPVDVKYLTYQEAMDMSTVTSWVMGQATEFQPERNAGTDNAIIGKLFTFDPTKQRLAILGAGGGGKTESAAFDVINKARHFGMDVVVLDGKMGIDLGILEDVVEHHNLTPDNLRLYMRQIMDIYNERWDYLIANKGMNNIYKDKSQKYKPIVLLIEEFGDCWDRFSAKHKGDEFSEVEGWIDTLFRLGRATGIIVILVDQSPNLWTKQMRGGSIPVCFQIGGGVAAGFNEYHANQLKTGYFSNNNIFYKAWHVAAEVDMANDLQPQSNRYLSDDYVIVEDETSEAKGSKAKTQKKTAKSVDPEPIIERREPVTEVEYSLQRIYDRDKNMKHKKWQAFVRQYIKLADKFPEDHPMRKYPVAEIADRMAVCELGRYDKDLSDRRKSQASQWYSKIMAERQSEQPEPIVAGMSMSEWQEIPV